ncbi:MAG: FAD:protein FMN transferase [Verrucomicrobia bacterium]|nr:FAD:protein FMN transferase [Verrucomicrobiota bacterium]
MNNGNRNRLSLRLLTLVLLVGAACDAPAAGRVLQRLEFIEPHMGALFRIVLYAPDADTGSSAATAAFQRIKALNRIMSDYDPDSELMRLCKQPAAVPARVSNDLFDIIRKSQELARLSVGAFDITVGPLVRLWRTARRTHTLPAPEAIAAAKQRVGCQKLKLDPSRKTVTLLAPDMQLDLGGIAKGYAADAALAVLRQRGIRSAFVAASGDIAIGDAPPGMAGWKMGIASPAGDDKLAATVLLRNAAVSTSGDIEQFVDIGGTRYSHIVDPRTGLGLTDRLQASFIARNATTTDALATALCVMGTKRAIKLADSLPDAAAFLVRPGPNGNETTASRRFDKFRAPASSLPKK